VGDVVDAVAALVPGHDPVGALEHADVVGQALEVAERRGGDGRDLHATPEAGSNGLACPLTSRAVAEHPPRPRVVNAQSRYPRTRRHVGRPARRAPLSRRSGFLFSRTGGANAPENGPGSTCTAT